jgi:hypothetical protein
MSDFGIEIVNYDGVARCFGVSRKTVYGWTWSKRLPVGCYLGHGRFSMTAIKRAVEAGNIFSRPAKRNLTKTTEK